MKRFQSLVRHLVMGAAAIALCAGVACSGGTETPDADVTDDTQGDVLDQEIPDDTVISDHTSVDTQVGDTFDEILTDVISQEVLDLIAQGKVYLSAGESLAAMDSFREALNRMPGLHDAEFGMVLARLQSTVSMFSSLAGLINFKDDPDAIPVSAWRSLSWTDHDGTMGATMDTMWYAAVEQQERIDALKAAPDATFNLPGGLPLAFRDDLMMNLCCDWDISDIYGISSFNNLMLAFVSFIGSQNTDASLDHVEKIFKEAPGISNSITQMMDAYPEFMNLIPDGGEEMWKATKGYLLASTQDALESARLMGVGNDLENNVATLTADANPYLELHGTFPNGGTSMEILWDGKNVSMKEVVEHARDHFSGTADSQLSLNDDVLVAISVLVDIINRTVGIETLVTSFGITLPDIVTGLLGSLDKNDPEQLAGMLPSMTSLLGIESGTVFLDVAGFLDHPFNLRDLFPNYGPEPGTTYKTFTKSFECIKGGTIINGIDSGDALAMFVHDSDVVVSTAHVTVTTYATPDMTGEAFDTEQVELPAYPDFEGLYMGSVILQTADAPTVADDGFLAIPAGGSLSGTYTSLAANDDLVVFGGNMADGFTPWDYGAACPEGSFAWDSTRFGETEFGTAVEVTAPGVTTPLQSIDADGDESLVGMMAFKSPSFNGLLWLKTDDGMAPTTQSTFAGIFAGVLNALEGF